MASEQHSNVHHLRFPGEQPGVSIFNRSNQLKAAYRPHERVMREWRREAERREDTTYVNFWFRFWVRTVIAVSSFGSIGSTDMVWIDEYVRHCRLADMHNYEALQDPYVTYESGYVGAHPGFAHGRAEARSARAVANELGLTPRLRREAGVDVPRPGDSQPLPQDTNDDQLGPEGEPL